LALRHRNYTLAQDIETQFIEECEKIETFSLRDKWIEQITIASI